MANFCCPIETEPRTLNEGQLNFAREAAADAVQKMEINKASTILEVEEFEQILLLETEQTDEKGHQPQHSAECKEGNAIGKPCQCLCINTTVELESPDQGPLKEPLSAPF